MFCASFIPDSGEKNLFNRLETRPSNAHESMLRVNHEIPKNSGVGFLGRV